MTCPVKGVSYYSHRTLGERTFDIFGEMHDLTKDEVEAEAEAGEVFTEWLHSRGPDCDVFVELPYVDRAHPTRSRGRSYMLGLIEETYRDRLGPVKPTNMAEGPRLHYIDYRHAGTSIHLGGITYLYIVSGLTEAYSDKYIPERFSHKAFRTLAERVRAFIRTDAKLQKQIRLSEVGPQLEAYVEWRLRKSVASYERLHVPQGLVKDHVMRLRYLAKEFVGLYSVIMDTYALARMFRRAQGGAQYRNIIVYVGRAHARAYDEFLDALSKTRVPSPSSPQRP